MVRFIRSTWPLVPGGLTLVKRCSMPVSLQRMPNRWVHVSCCRAVGVARRKCELDAVVGETGVDFGWNGFDQGFQEGSRGRSSGLFDELDKGKLTRAVDGDAEIQLAFGSLDRGEVDMKTAAGAGSEFLLVGPVALNIGQPGNAVALQTPRHCGTAEMLARRKGNHPAATADADGKQRRSLRPQWRAPLIWDLPGQSARRTMLPLGHGFPVDPVALRQNPQALLTSLYRSTDRRCRRGTAMKNLAHRASLHA